MTVQNLYTQYLDGKVTKQKFLYEVRRDQNLTMISPTNSFDDVIKILKNKSIISEKASKESKQSTGKQDVEIISKTIDMVNPYEYARGMDYELDIIDVPATSGDLHTDNVLRAQKKVLANLTKNPQYYFEKLYGKDKFDGDETVEINKKSTDAIGKGKNAKIIREVTDAQEKYRVKPSAKPTQFKQDIAAAKKMIDAGKSEKEVVAKYGQAAFNAVNAQNLGEGNLGHNEKSSIHQEGGSWIVTYKKDGTKEKVFKSEAEAKKFQNSLDEGLEGDHITKEDIANELSNRGASDSEIEQYLNSLERSNDVYETLEDYVEDFLNYVADKSLNESYKPFPMNEDQESVLKRYAESTGIAFENLLNMVAEAKAKKKAKKDYDGDGKIESSEEEYKGSRDKAIKQAIGEDIDLGHQDNEPHMIKGELYQIAKQATELYKIINSVDNMGEVDFPHWWQSKIILAKNYLEGAKDYLESALATGNEEGELAENETPEEAKARTLELQAEKAKIAASQKKISDLNQGR
jgi:hypothetical protein